MLQLATMAFQTRKAVFGNHN